MLSAFVLYKSARVLLLSRFEAGVAHSKETLHPKREKK